MDLTDITPLILTYNEAPNIGRCLERLQWASQILVLDSGSSDDTAAIVHRFPNTTLLQRPFDNHTAQWNYGLDKIATRWVLSLDADYIIPNDFTTELQQLNPSPEQAAYYANFHYCLKGKSLRSNLYPARAVLFDKTLCRYIQDGHTQLLSIQGSTDNLQTIFDHDDRKSLSRWLDSQKKYAQLEAEKLLSSPPATLPDRLRKMILPAPPAALFYTLFFQGLILDGWPGIYYALQRTYAEMLLSLEILDRKLDQNRTKAS